MFTGPPTATQVTRLLERLRELGIPTDLIAGGLLAMTRSREPGDDDDECDADEEGLVPLGEVLNELTKQEAERARIAAEVVRGSTGRIQELIRASGRRRR